MDSKKPRTLTEALGETVPKLFGFLVSEYGFSLTQKEDWCFVAMSKDSKFGIFLENDGQVNVTFRHFTVTDKNLPEKFKYLLEAGGTNVIMIAECLDPQIHIKFDTRPKPEDVQIVLEKYVELIRKYLTPFLKGDFSNWTKVET